MRPWRRVILCEIVTSAAMLVPLHGQEKVDVAPPPSPRFPAAWYPPDNDVTSTMPPVHGAPYEAHMVMNGGQPGTPVDHEPLYARDSEGRTRTEQTTYRTGADAKPVQVREVEVQDAVTHCTFHWIEPWLEKSTPIATVSCMSRKLHYGGQPMWASAASMTAAEEHPSSMETDRNVSLGERNFDGVRATGVRHTRIIQPTTPENAYKTVAEFWVSTEMKEVVAMYQEFPDGLRFELRNIRLHEPDAALFYPPAGYRIDASGTTP